MQANPLHIQRCHLMRKQTTLRPAPVALFGADYAYAVRARRLWTEIVGSSRTTRLYSSAFIMDAAQDLSPCPGFACKRVQMLAGVCLASPDGAIEVMRTKAVMPTATAPITEKTACQVSDGMRCLTIPWVA